MFDDTDTACGRYACAVPFDVKHGYLLRLEDELVISRQQCRAEVHEDVAEEAHVHHNLKDSKP